jgi:predicted ATPase/DNA-binding SARP family transcriptional activator/tetratricopeptide (TPR) repeat protein
MLGSFSVSRNGVRPNFRTRKTAGILAYLAFYADQHVAKDVLIDAFWPESVPEKGRQSLRMALSSIRETLGLDDHGLYSDRQTVRLSSSRIIRDVSAFEEGLRSSSVSEVENALHLYQGRFLSGMSEDWVDPQALELEERFALGVVDFVRRHLHGSDGNASILMARRAISIVGMREDLAVALMRAYASTGQASRAVEVYDQLATFLMDEWGEEPSRDAQSVLDDLPSATETKVTVVAPRQLHSADVRSFYGREEERRSLAEAVAPDTSHRLVTVVGIGGTGKTALANAVFTDVSESYKQQAWMVGLVGAGDAVQLAQTVAEHVVGERADDPVERLVAGIGDQAALLLLDNVEHLRSETRDFVEKMLGACPALVILLTSRVPLLASRERVFPLGPMSLPSQTSDLRELRGHPVARIFVDAALAVRPGFEVTTTNAASVVLLCHRCEGFPLAVQLAASQLATLTPAQVLAGLGKSADLRTALQGFEVRHRSLEAVVRWSLSLLDPAEAQNFLRLSVCRGGFTAELARTVMGSDGEDLLTRFVQLGLMRWEEDERQLRFSILETIREVARERLDEDDIERNETLRRHFAGVRALLSPPNGDDEWMARVLADRANVHVAFATATEGLVSPIEAWETFLNLNVLISRGIHGRQWVQPLTELLEATESALTAVMRSDVHDIVARASFSLRALPQAYEHFMASLVAADEAGNLPAQLRARRCLPSPGSLLGKADEVEPKILEALQWPEVLGHFEYRRQLETSLAWLALYQGRAAESLRLFEGATIDLYDRSNAIGAGAAAGEIDPREGIQLLTQILTSRSSAIGFDSLANARYLLARLLLKQGCLQDAVDMMRQCLAAYSVNGISLGQVPLLVAGSILSAIGESSLAQEAWQRSAFLRQEQQMVEVPLFKDEYEAARAALRIPAQVPAGWSDDDFLARSTSAFETFLRAS